jgi:hypothetical protein
MSEMNDGIQIILNRMKTNPEEFFEDGGRWKWIFKEVMREVMTETEKVAIHEELKKVRRMEITAKAAATILKVDEQQKEEAEAYYGKAIAKMEGAPVNLNPKKLVISAAQAEMIKRMNK